MDIGELGYDYTNKVFYVGNGVGSEPTRLLTANNLTKDIVTNALGYTPPTSDTNTTYSAGTGISLSGTTFSNSGVRSIATGTANGTISVNTNGSSANVAVKGLGSAAYTADTSYVKTSGNQTVAGQKTFTGNAIFNASPYVVNNMLINSYGTDGKAVGMIAVTNENNLVIGHKTNSHSGDTIIRAVNGRVKLATSGASTGGLELEDGHIYMTNGGTLKIKGTSGNHHNAVMLSGSNNLHLGASETGDHAHTGNTYVNAINGSVYLRNSNSTDLRWFAYKGSGYSNIFRCDKNSAAALGSDSARWYKLYAASACSTSSDEREKSDIMYMSDYPVPFSRNGNNGNTFEQFFDRLVPATYTLNVESTDDLHIGFIAQDVEKAADEVGLPIDELGFIQHSYWKDEETGEEKDRYALCYEEFIALNTYMIQKQKAQIKEQQEQINSLEERIAQLETLLSK